MVTGEVDSQVPLESVGIMSDPILVLVIGSLSIRYGIFQPTDHVCQVLSTFHLNQGTSLSDGFIQWTKTLDPDWRFARVTVGVEHVPITFIPKSLYDKDFEPSMLEFKDIDVDASSILRQDVVAMNAIAICAVEEALIPAIKSKFPTAQVQSQVALTAHSMIQDQLPSSKPKVFLKLDKSQLEIYAVEGKELHYYNRFTYSHANDLLYYTQLVLNELDWGQSIERLWVWGQISEAGLSEVHKYYKTDHFFGFKFQRLDGKLGGIPKEQYADLFNLFQCV